MITRRPGTDHSSPGGRRFLAALALAGASLVVPAPLQAQESGPTAEVSTAEVEDAIFEAQELARRHRYQEILDLLQPLAPVVQEPEASYAVAAELGRALFHLGQYQLAHDAFVRAVRLHPERVESALYLEATFYLTGRPDRALDVFKEVLKTGSDDLYLAVTLPGERAFLAEPGVWAALAEHEKPVDIDLERFELMGVRLDQPRATVVAALGANPADPGAPVLTARAGPKLIWAFSFDQEGQLEEITVEVEHLVKYTPYRPRLSNGLDWRTTPAAALGKLGPPASSAGNQDGELAFDWELAAGKLTLVFAEPLPPRPPPLARDGAILIVVRMARSATTAG